MIIKIFRYQFITGLCIIWLGLPSVFAQENIITAGFQFKPVFSSKFFNTGEESVIEDSITYGITPGSGYCVGMVIRKGITKSISFETGINYVKRNYELNIIDSAGNENTEFKIVGYEIPLQGLVFIQLSDQIFMDVAMGLSVDFFPSDIQTFGEKYNHYSARKSWITSSVIANLGWEYRTEKSGYFYLGGSFHRPFNFIYTSKFKNKNSTTNPDPIAGIDLNGNYLTLDIRYFFHSDPDKRKKKVKK